MEHSLVACRAFGVVCMHFGTKAKQFSKCQNGK